MKFLPILFYLLVFEPEKESVVVGVFMTAVGFATFENVCYLAQNGAQGVADYLAKADAELRKAMAYTGCTTMDRMDPGVIHTTYFTVS